MKKNEILIHNSVVGNSRTFLLSPNLQRNTEVHKTLTQICICWTVLIVAVSASLTNDGNLSHFDFKSHTYSVPLRWILPTLWCKYNILSVGNQTQWESAKKIFHSLPVLHITFKGSITLSPWNFFWRRLHFKLQQAYFFSRSTQLPDPFYQDIWHIKPGWIVLPIFSAIVISQWITLPCCASSVEEGYIISCATM